MPRVAFVALDLGAQRTAKYAPAPKPSCALSPRTLTAPRYETRRETRARYFYPNLANLIQGWRRTYSELISLDETHC